MADKEVTVYIVDLGSSMGDCNNGRVESDLDWSMRYVWHKICETVAASRKTWQVGVIGLRTDESDNPTHEAGEEGYENISVLQDIGPMSMTALNELRGKVTPSSTQAGDAVSAIVVATQMIDKAAPARLKYTRRIVLVTGGRGSIDGDELDGIWSQINEQKIDLIIVGVDFDDLDKGFKEEDKPEHKRNNEALLKSLVAQCSEDSIFSTMASEIDELEIPKPKQTRPYKAYDGQLTLGNPKKFENAAISIHVERYFKTKVAMAVAASNVTVKNEPRSGMAENGNGESSSAAAGGDFSSISNARNYKVNDPSAPGGKRDVPFESLAKGYTYGRTIVHISESDQNVTKMETEKEFTILGFIPEDKYEPILNMGTACVSIATKYSEKDEIAFSALVNAMIEAKYYAVARIVAKDGKEAQLVLLMPAIEPEYPCLYDVPLPFAEDLRRYPFPPLDRVVTINGTVVTEKHRLLPSEELDKAMSDYVDAMDISSSNGIDENGNPLEHAPIHDTFTPKVHRVNQAIRSRAAHPDEPLKPPAGMLTHYSKPPIEVVEKSVDQIKKLIKVADIKKVPPKAKGKRQRERIEPLSGLDVEALLNLGSQPSKRPKIEASNAVPQFKQALARAEDEAEIEDASNQMGEIVTSLIKNSLSDANYERAAENMRVMRDGLVALEEPALYNDFLRALKKQVASGALDGDRREMWYLIKFQKLGLVTKTETDASDVTEEEAKEFISSAK